MVLPKDVFHRFKQFSINNVILDTLHMPSYYTRKYGKWSTILIGQ